MLKLAARLTYLGVRIDGETGFADQFAACIQQQHRVCTQCSTQREGNRQRYLPVNIGRSISIENKKTPLSLTEYRNFIEWTIRWSARAPR